LTADGFFVCHGTVARMEVEDEEQITTFKDDDLPNSRDSKWLKVRPKPKDVHGWNPQYLMICRFVFFPWNQGSIFRFQPFVFGRAKWCPVLVAKMPLSEDRSAELFLEHSACGMQMFMWGDHKTLPVPFRRVQ